MNYICVTGPTRQNVKDQISQIVGDTQGIVEGAAHEIELFQFNSEGVDSPVTGFVAGREDRQNIWVAWAIYRPS